MKQIMLTVCGVLLLTGCGQSTTKRPALSWDAGVGKSCTVQFRRDALGAAADIPIPPTTDVINGVPVTLVGTLKSRDDLWTVVDAVHGDESSTYVIPTHAILLLKISVPPATAKPKP